MRFEPALHRGRLLRRYKRFLADIDVGGEVRTLHCPNTGAMTGCAEPGSEAWFSISADPRRKYPGTLEVVCTPRGRVGVNTSLANRLVAEAIGAGRVPELAGYSDLSREVAIPGERGRFDFSLVGDCGTCWVEVKSMTLCLEDGTGAFPDAVSERALRHVQALMARRQDGERAVLLFCVQHTGVRWATPADHIQPAYGAALRAAVDLGVEVLAYGCGIERDEISLTMPLPVRL